MFQILYWLYSFAVESTKMYLLTGKILGSNKSRRDSKTVYILYVAAAALIAASAAIQSKITGYVMIGGTILLTMVWCRQILKPLLSYFIITLFDFFIGSGLIMLMNMEYDTAYASQGFSIFVGAVSFFLLFAVSVIKERFKKKISINRRDAAVLVVLLFGLLAFSVPVLRRYLQNNAVERSVQVYLGILAAMVAMLIIFIQYQSISHEKDRYLLEIQAKDRFIDEQKRYYEMLLRKEEETKKFRHDITSQLRCLHEYIRKDHEKAEAYLDEIIRDMKHIPKIISTGNFVVDIAVNDTLPKSGCNVSWKGIFPQELLITEKDLFVLFSNLFRNAQEAVLGENMQILCSVRNLEKNMIVEIENPVKEKAIMEDGVLKTTKDDQKNHGYGTRIIQEIVKKYCGKISYENISNKFKVTLVLLNVVK